MFNMACARAFLLAYISVIDFIGQINIGVLPTVCICVLLFY